MEFKDCRQLSCLTEIPPSETTRGRGRGHRWGAGGGPGGWASERSSASGSGLVKVNETVLGGTLVPDQDTYGHPAPPPTTRRLDGAPTKGTCEDFRVDSVRRHRHRHPPLPPVKGKRHRTLNPPQRPTGTDGVVDLTSPFWGYGLGVYLIIQRHTIICSLGATWSQRRNILHS